MPGNGFTLFAIPRHTYPSCLAEGTSIVDSENMRLICNFGSKIKDQPEWSPWVFDFHSHTGNFGYVRSRTCFACQTCETRQATQNISGKKPFRSISMIRVRVMHFEKLGFLLIYINTLRYQKSEYTRFC